MTAASVVGVFIIFIIWSRWRNFNFFVGITTERFILDICDNVIFCGWWVESWTTHNKVNDHNDKDSNYYPRNSYDNNIKGSFRANWFCCKNNINVEYINLTNMYKVISGLLCIKSFIHAVPWTSYHYWRSCHCLINGFKLTICYKQKRNKTIR